MKKKENVLEEVIYRNNKNYSLELRTSRVRLVSESFQLDQGGDGNSLRYVTKLEYSLR